MGGGEGLFLLSFGGLAPAMVGGDVMLSDGVLGVGDADGEVYDGVVRTGEFCGVA